MLSPVAVQLVLKHFDAIDGFVSRRLLRKRPWQEPALTTLLCDLLDEDVQAEEKLDYTAQQLNKDLRQADEPIHVSLEIEAHQYPASVERWVTQADLGLILSYQSQFPPHDSWTRGWLLQGKRLTPSQRNPLRYDCGAGFSGFDRAQHSRIEELIRRAAANFVRYLLFCPRPRDLTPDVRAQLSHERSQALADDIFDFTLGLQRRDDLLAGSPTIAAGMFISEVDQVPQTLAEVHRSIFRSTTPFSWFVVQHFAPSRERRHSLRPDGNNVDNPVVNGIVRGDPDVIQSIVLHDTPMSNRPFAVLPAHTVTIGITEGIDLPQSRG